VEKSVERTQRTYIKLALGILIGFVLSVFLCWGGCRLYSMVESQHLSRRGAAYLSGGDLRQAALSARRALQLDETSVPAIRVLARVAEASDDRNAIDWRRKAADLEPNSTEDTLALANCALQFNDLATAEKTLQRINQNARDTAEFHAAAARLANAKKQPAEVENHWGRVVGLAPQNKSYQLESGLALLRTNEQAKKARGRETLESLRGDEKQRAAATRALIVDLAAQHVDNQKLVVLARELQDYPEATFSDRILYLDILRQLRAPEFTPYLTTVEKDAASKPADLAVLISWMKASGMSLLAIDFARTLPDETLSKWPVPLAVAEAYAKLADWAALERWVKNKNWGQFEFMRHGYLALALREQDKSVASDQEWTTAQKEAEGQPQFLSMLTRAVVDWRWEKERVDLLWTLTKQPESQLEALHGLYQKYADAGDTLGLYRVLARLAEIQPDDAGAQNNLAQISLLLNANVERARKLAAELYRKEGSNPAYASTYAFALFRKGDIHGALKVMSALPEEQLRDPSLAAYYGIILAAAGDTAKAREYLKIGASAKLLPEEKALLAKAESRAQ
jgi:predicted Zn-dependent protease